MCGKREIVLNIKSKVLASSGFWFKREYIEVCMSEWFCVVACCLCVFSFAYVVFVCVAL